MPDSAEPRLRLADVPLRPGKRRMLRLGEGQPRPEERLKPLAVLLKPRRSAS